jgi:two-component system, chemotaxis family, chemotaxis protein CheY
MMVIDKEIKILLVDDSVGIRLTAKKLLNKLGFNQVTVADDGTTALEQLQVGDFDLVIADWNMQQMSGLELLEAMKANPSLADTPFILVTGEDDQEILMKAIKAGINAFMTKPYEAQTLSQKIERVFEFRREQQHRPG